MPAGLTTSDSMFSVREVPWHGLGAVLDTYPKSIDEALAKSGLEWEVNQGDVLVVRPAGTETPDGVFIPQLESVLVPAHGFKANIREDNGEVLGIVSDDYRVVPNRDAFAFLDSLINSDLHFETAGSLRGGRRVWVLARLPEWVEVGGDPVHTYLYVANSHDGSMAVTAAVSPIRVVCQNTLNAALRRSEYGEAAQRTFRFRHTGDLKLKYEEARRVMGIAVNYEKQFKVLGDRLASEPLTPDRFDNRVARPLVYNGERPEDLGKRAVTNREQARERLNHLFQGGNETAPQNAPETKWAAYNAVAEFSDWDRRMTKRSDQMQRSFESTEVKDRGLSLVLAA